ncbi:MAG: toxic anion resistance protein [Epsilonproteobacteria bacterium]|jgi:uncharacterized protein YaaN involved in tellurite resistance|nr:toxic anion resistance protein [Campylobacterota bacterium]NPA89059.1 toxic anion resistance protein [Campylobacterota bacterium]
MEKQVLQKVEEVIVNKSDKPVEPVDEKERQIVEQLKSQLKVDEPSSVIYFGVEAQEQLDKVSSEMIEGVKNRDLGDVGKSLTDLISALKGFDVEEFTEESPWWKKLLGIKSSIEELFEEYREVKDQIDEISNTLEEHRLKLSKDLIGLEKLYEANLDYFRKLELYLKAGEEKLKELDEKIIPELREKAKASNDLIDAQKLKEVVEFRNDLERRVHDLRLSRQVAIQALASIKLVQENDKSLINKITSTLVNTIPLWKNQLAQAVAIARSKEAAGAVKEANDFTNELLKKSAEGLREANKMVKTEVERGIFDVEVIKEANQTLINTLYDSLEIANKGREARQKAIQELKHAEEELKKALTAVKEERYKLNNKS